MAAWVVIVVTDLNDYLAAAQMTALRTVALASGQSDPFATVMHDRCSYIRNRISKRVQISATAHAVPPELKTQACYLIIEAMQARLPGLALTDEQKRMIERSYKDLDIAATEEFPVSNADDPETPEVQSGAGVEIANRSNRKASRSRLEAL